MKNQGRIINERIDQTKNNLKRLDRQAEDHKQSIVVQKVGSRKNSDFGLGDCMIP